MAKYVIKAGESLSLDLNVMSDSDMGMVAEVASVSAGLKKAAGPGMIPAKSVPCICDFEVQETFKGWSFSLDSVATAKISPGLYIMDAKITMKGGTVVITDPVQVEVRGSVT